MLVIECRSREKANAFQAPRAIEPVIRQRRSLRLRFELDVELHELPRESGLALQECRLLGAHRIDRVLALLLQRASPFSDAAPDRRTDLLAAAARAPIAQDDERRILLDLRAFPRINRLYDARLLRE